MKHNKFQKSIVLLLIIFVFLFLVSISKMPVTAQTVINQGTESPTPDSSTSLIIQQQKNDLELLKNKVDIMSEYNNRLMSTVQWTIGIVITILVVILGANWFTSYKQINSEVESFKTTTLFNITKESELIKEQLKEMLDTQFSNIEEEIFSSISAQHTLLNQQIIDLRICQLATEAQLWEEKSVWANALRIYVEIINLNPNTSLLNNYLIKLQSAIINYGEKLPALYVGEIEEAITKISNFQNTNVLSSKILELVKNQS